MNIKTLRFMLSTHALADFSSDAKYWLFDNLNLSNTLVIRLYKFHQINYKFIV